MTERIAKLGVAFGKKGVGKTWTTWKMIEQYVTGNPAQNIKPRRALILDVNDEYTWVRAISINDVSKFSNSKIIEVRRVRAFNERTGQPMTLKEIASALFYILQYYRRGLLLIEDINVYISDNLPNDLIGAICRNRHTELDIILHYQSIGRLATKVWQNVNWLRFHKITDNVDRHIKKFEDKYEYLRITELIVNNKYREGDKRFYVYIDIDEEKLHGRFSKDDFVKACEEYISLNEKSMLRPILNKKDSNGEIVIKNYKDGFDHVCQRLISDYTLF